MAEIEKNYPTLLAGRYRLHDEIGRGGMGVVLLCTDAKTGARYAAKLLNPEQPYDAHRLKHFRSECKILAQLQHPNIVRLVDYGAEQGIPFLIMELCTNRHDRTFSLHDLQQASPERQVPARQLGRILPPVLAAMAEVHRNGLVHRDVKPENILLIEARDHEYLPKLSDFGLVALTADEDLRDHTRLSVSVSLQATTDREKALVGTYAYMSPEQKRGETLDARSDVYSLGLMLYRLATGYERVSFALPSDVVVGMPEWIDHMVKAAIDEDREDRAASAEALYALLPTQLQDPQRPRLTLSRPAAEADRWWVRPLAAVLVAAAVLALAVGGGAWGFKHWRSIAPAAPVSVVEEIRQALEQGDPEARESALFRLKSRPRIEAVALLPQLAAALAAKETQARILAANILGRLGAQAVPAVPALARAVGDPEHHVAVAAIRALAALGASAAPAAPALLGLLDHRNAELRRLAEEALGKIGAPATVEFIPYHLRLGNIDTVAKIGAPAVPLLLRTIADDEPEARRGAADALGAMRPRAIAAIRPLIELLRQEPPGASDAAAVALRLIGLPAVPALSQLIVAERGSLRHRAAAIVEDIGPGPSVEFAPFLLYKGDHETLFLIGLEALPELTEALAGKNSTARHAAVRVLRELGRDAAPAVPALTKLLEEACANEEGLRDLTVDTLVALGPESVPVLVGALSHDLPDPADTARQPPTTPPVTALVRFQFAVVETLGDIGKDGADAGPVLLRLLRTGHRTLAPAAAAALAKIGVQQTAAYTPYFAYKAMNAASPETRLAALGAIGRIGPGAAAVVPTLAAIVASIDRETTERAAAAHALGAIGKAAVPALRSRLPKEEQAVVAAEIVAGLGKIGLPAAEAAPEVLAYLRRGAPRARARAALALGAFGHQVTPVLVAALPEPESQRWLIKALHAIGPEAVPALHRALDHHSELTRNGAVRALREFGPGAAGSAPRLIRMYEQGHGAQEDILLTLGAIGPGAAAAAPLMIRALGGSGLRLRAAAEAGLGQLGADGVPPLVQALERSKTSSLQQALIRALGAVGPEAAAGVPALAGLLRDDKYSYHRPAVLKALGRIGRPARPAIPLVVALLTSNNLAVRRDAAMALGGMGAAALETVPAIERAIEANRDLVFADRAKQAIEDIHEDAARALDQERP